MLEKWQNLNWSKKTTLPLFVIYLHCIDSMKKGFEASFLIYFVFSQPLTQEYAK